MTVTNNVPKNRYGILVSDTASDDLASAREQIARLGFAVLDSGFSDKHVQHLAECFDDTRQCYIERFGEDYLRERDELFTVRGMLLHGQREFLDLAFNANLHRLLNSLIPGKYILNQQNGIVNPPQRGYNQGSWHRDLPYQHFTSSRPLAINALYCVDDFTLENGATYVLPATHLREPFPSDDYVERHAIQSPARAGQFIVLDCMLFHAGGFNTSGRARRAVNHVFTIPLMKQQIQLAAASDIYELDASQRELLGAPYLEPSSVEAYIAARPKRSN